MYVRLSTEEVVTALIAIHRYRRDTHCSEPRAELATQIIPTLQRALKKAVPQQAEAGYDIALAGN